MKRASRWSATARFGSKRLSCGCRSFGWNKRIAGCFLLAAILPVQLTALLPRQAEAQTPRYAGTLAVADSAYARFDPRAALGLYEEALRLGGAGVFAIEAGLTRTHYDIGLDLLAEPGSESPESHFNLAVASAERLVAAYPERALSHVLLAAALGNLAQFKGGKERIMLAREVERHSRAAIAIDSLLAYPYISLGVLYRELAGLTWAEHTWAKLFYGEVPQASRDEAIELLLRAAELDPLNPFVHHELAQTYLHAGDTTPGVAHLRLLLALKPQTTQDIRNQTNARLWLRDTPPSPPQTKR